MPERSPSSMATPEVPKESEYMHDGRLKIVIAGLDQNIRAHAIDAADARLEEETNQKGGVKGWIKNRIWKGVLFRDSYRQKYETEATKDIVENENLLHHHKIDAASYERAATLRLMHDYEEMQHQGERRRKIAESNDSEATYEQDYELKQEIFGLIGEFAAGTIDKENFQEKKKRLLKSKADEGFDENVLGKEVLTADNLLQIAQNVKAMVAYRVATGQGGIDDILENTDIIIGSARVGARTEVHRGWVDRAADKMKSKGKNGGLVNEANLGASSALLLTGIVKGAKAAGAGFTGLMVGTSIAGAVPLAGLAGGAFESRVLRQERGRHGREMATGDEADRDDKRRIELETTRYDTRTASELTTLLGGLYDGDQLRISDQESYHQAMDALAEVKARIQISDERSIDLISFSSIDKIEQERFDLDLALAKAKCDIKRALQESEDSELQSLSDFDPLNPHYLDAKKGMLQTEIDQKDRLYKKLRTTRVSKAVLKATVVTLLTGGAFFAVEEIASYLKGKSSVVDTAMKFIKKDTLPTDKYTPPDAEIKLSGNTQSVSLGEYAKMNIPEEFKISQNQDGTLSVSGPEGMKINGITLKEDGHLTSQSEQLLRAAGFEISAVNGTIVAPESQNVEVSGKEFIENHPDETTDVSRGAWWENQTATPDGTELGLENPQIDADGNVVITMSNLDMATSSMANGEVNLQELAANGELKVALSASVDTQAQVFMLDMDANGQAIVPLDSSARSLFDQDGNFQGGFMEVVQETGDKDSDGASILNVFATAVGPDTNSLQDTVITSQSHAGTIYNIEYNPPSGEALAGGEGESAPSSAGGSADSPPPPLATSVYGRRGLGGEAMQTPVVETLVSVPEAEAIRQLEKMKPGDKFEARLSKYQGPFEFIGTFGGKLLFEAIDSASQPVPDRPIYTMTKDEARQVLQNGRLKGHT